jgi:SagB-type dehydrogenase family enzyme
LTAREYHDRTAHSPASVRTGGHTLEWDIKPFPFKIYTELSSFALPRELDPPAIDTLAAIAGPQTHGATLTLSQLATLLYHSAGVTRKKTYPGGGEILFRAAASTGALYQTEVYVAVGQVAGLDAGLYHFCPGDFTLRRLRAGDVRQAFATAAGDDSLASRAATVLLTGIYWRNAWKYQARAYRHLFWDSGTMLANLLAVASGLELAPRVLTGFVDGEVNRLLGLDAAREVALELVVVGHETSIAPAGGALEAIDHPTLPLSSSEVDYPLVREIHLASSLSTSEAVRAWRLQGGAGARGVAAETTLAATRDVESASPTAWSDPENTGLGSHPPRPRPALQVLRAGGEHSPSAGEPPALAREAGAPSVVVALPAPRREAGRGLGETIQRRGSTRQFGHAPLTAEELATALWAATRSFEADVPAGLVDLYLIVNSVGDVPPGAYFYQLAAHALELLAAGDFRNRSSYLCLEQPLGGDAAAVIYFIVRLEDLLRVFGDRGYRLTNLEAGLAGGRAYLAAYAQGFGASGLTFYDRHVVEFFSPHAAGKDAIFVTALGRSAVGDRVTIESNLTLRRRPSA